jgi:beta-lactam-binding protein with PASTA domain
MVALLACVFFISAGIVTYLSVRGRRVEVPNVLGKYEDEAEKEIDAAGLRMQIKSRAHDNKWPVNTISDQSPVAGSIVKTGQIVRVSLSLGSETSPAQSAQK